MQVYQTLLQHHPQIREQLVELFRDECADHRRQGRRYSLDHFCADLSDDLFLTLQERGIPDSTDAGKKVPA